MKQTSVKFQGGLVSCNKQETTKPQKQVEIYHIKFSFPHNNPSHIYSTKKRKEKKFCNKFRNYIATLHIITNSIITVINVNNKQLL